MVQSFVNDEEERKFNAVFNNVVENTFNDLSLFFNYAYKSVELGNAIYETQKMPIYKILEKSLFKKAYSQILDGQKIAGSFEGYLKILKAIFGETAEINFTVLGKAKLKIDIVAESQELYVMKTRSLSNPYLIKTKDNFHLAFNELLAKITNRQLLNLLKSTTKAGFYVEFTINERDQLWQN